MSNNYRPTLGEAVIDLAKVINDGVSPSVAIGQAVENACGSNTLFVPSAKYPTVQSASDKVVAAGASETNIYSIIDSSGTGYKFVDGVRVTNAVTGKRDTPCSKRLQPMNGNATQMTDVLQFTSRRHYPISIATKGLRLVYANVQKYGIPNNNPITIKAAVECDFVSYSNATLIPVTFDGKDSITLQPGEIVVSDAIPNRTFFQNENVWIRTFVSVTANGMYIPHPVARTDNADKNYNDLYRGEDYVTGKTGKEADPTWGLDNFQARGYAPITLIGQQALNSHVPVVGVVGDSISTTPTLSATYGVNNSWYANVLNANGIPFIGLAEGGMWAGEHDFGAPVGTWLRSRDDLLFKYLLGMCDHIICALGRNDLSNNTATVTEANLLAIWKVLALKGAKIYQTTITPLTSSTDSWATTGNQTTLLTVALCDNPVNEYIRTLPSPLSGYLEMANAVTSADNSGIWKADMTADGIHPYKDAGVAAMQGVLSAAISTFKTA